MAFVLPLAWPAAASDLTVKVIDGDGKPVSDAVVTLTPDASTRDAATLSSTERPASATRIIDQKNETFLPYVQVFRPGDMTVFRNSDTTRHHVYSFSPIKSFEFVLRPGESSPPLTLEQIGIAAVGCNIHDHMITYLYVSDAQNIAVSGTNGQITLPHLSTGPYTLHLWHPQLHPGRPDIVRAVHIDGKTTPDLITLTVSLLPDPRMQIDREHLGY
jgi:plastocyanin